MSIRLHNYAEVQAYLEKQHPDWAPSFDTATHQRASRLLASEVAGRYLGKRRHAELSRDQRTADQAQACACSSPRPGGTAFEVRRTDILCFPGACWLRRGGLSLPMTCSSRQFSPPLKP